MDRKMTVEVGGSQFTATLEDNEAVDALVQMMEENPVTIQMSDYAGFEKVGSLGASLPISRLLRKLGTLCCIREIRS